MGEMSGSPGGVGGFSRSMRSTATLMAAVDSRWETLDEERSCLIRILIQRNGEVGFDWLSAVVL